MQNTFIPANILLPNTNLEKWSVIACDQYTSDNDYWTAVKDFAGENPSALNLILPEIYLEDNKDKRIEEINKTMEKYLADGIFSEYKNAYIYVERTLKNKDVRKGLVGALNLEDYDFNKGASSLVRATEATVISRIPPRVQIRKDASLELPHVMLLFDDVKDEIFKYIASVKNTLKIVYDFDLMQNSGHIKGFLLTGETAEYIQKLFDKLTENKKDKLMLAVGDGNHSLATAKTCYENSKNELNKYALCEVVNIHDSSLNFEPIYRVLFDVDPEKFIEKFVNDLGGEYFGADAQKFVCVYKNGTKNISVKPTSKLSVGTLQKYLDEFSKDVKIDYIHDEEAVYKLCKEENTLGFIFDSMKKSELFDAVSQDGALPRKTFSMGHADDKRFYVEARKIK